MKRFKYRKWILENKYGKLDEQANIPFVCMNLQSTADAIDDGQSGLNSSEGYCVNTTIGGQFGALHQQFQNAGFGTYTTHSTLEECISSYNAGGNCNQGYEHSVYPPPSPSDVYTPDNPFDLLTTDPNAGNFNDTDGDFTAFGDTDNDFTAAGETGQTQGIPEPPDKGNKLKRRMKMPRKNFRKKRYKPM
tara:strand:- start:129 stop:698 length:570 start_codon:yes stop_codon:yes gene_type:complete